LNIHIARNSILQGDCDLALAGASAIRHPHGVGYVYIDGEVESPDGMCRPLDSGASGTLFGSAVTLVLLAKEEAVRNLNLTPLAWIIGSAANNDGRDKISYTASSGRGISDVVSSAIESAGIGADSIGYVEIHGTATKMGDPVEIQALTRAFRMHAKTLKEPIYLGAIKANIGHVDAAAGTAGLIKTVKILQSGLVPPVANFETGNPKIPWNKIPFKIPKNLVKFPDRKEQPRRAGITSLGVGGTNVHVILEAAIPSDYNSQIDNVRQPPCLPLIVSGKNQVALRENVKQIKILLDPDRHEPLPSLKDLTFSLATTRTNFLIRKALHVTSKDADEGYNILLK
jgi:acyl transferase domain-containing protein